jgi:hypothetical protein
MKHIASDFTNSAAHSLQVIWGIKEVIDFELPVQISLQTCT